jgi:hypothetical protein
MSLSMELYKNMEKLTKAQKARPITSADVDTVYRLFGPLVADQLNRDKRTAYPFYDSTSMIEQQWDALEAKFSVDKWVEWVKAELNKI